MKKTKPEPITHEEIITTLRCRVDNAKIAAKSYRKIEFNISAEGWEREAAIYREAIRRLEEHAARTKKTNELLVKLTKKRAARRRGRRSK